LLNYNARLLRNRCQIAAGTNRPSIVGRKEIRRLSKNYSATYEEKWVLCRNLTGPAILVGLAFRPNRVTAAVVAVEMWEPAFGAGFQARWDGQQVFGQDSLIGPTERHFHSEPAILPILVQMSSLGAAQDQNPRFQKAA
jgi:hypothetical protein